MSLNYDVCTDLNKLDPRLALIRSCRRDKNNSVVFCLVDSKDHNKIVCESEVLLTLFCEENKRKIRTFLLNECVTPFEDLSASDKLDFGMFIKF